MASDHEAPNYFRDVGTPEVFLHELGRRPVGHRRSRSPRSPSIRYSCARKINSISTSDALLRLKTGDRLGRTELWTADGRASTDNFAAPTFRRGESATPDLNT